MNIVFMGTPEFACKPLDALCQSRHNLLAVVTGEDKQRGRGKKTSTTAVCYSAECAGIPIIKTESLKSQKLYKQLENLKPDLFIVIAFRILPKNLINLPRFGAINIHASLLPKYRGAAPINWALINGETETGLTSFFLKKSVDTGDIILQEKIEINPEDNFDSLYEKLSELSGEFLMKTLEKIEQPDLTLLKQDKNKATPAPKITPFDAMIDFGFPSENILNFIRGMSTQPGAYTSYKGKKLKILFAKKAESDAEINSDRPIRPGTIVKIKKQLLVQCSDRPIELLQVVPDGKKPMDGVSFINGFKPEVGMIMGETSKVVK